MHIYPQLCYSQNTVFIFIHAIKYNCNLSHLVKVAQFLYLLAYGILFFQIITKIFEKHILYMFFPYSLFFSFYSYLIYSNLSVYLWNLYT